MTSRVLSASEAKVVHGLIAEGHQYPALVKLMLARIGKAISAPGITYHRNHHKAEIAEMRQQLDKKATRRERNRQAKAARRRPRRNDQTD